MSDSELMADMRKSFYIYEVEAERTKSQKLQMGMVPFQCNREKLIVAIAHIGIPYGLTGRQDNYDSGTGLKLGCLLTRVT
jgi:hypothetical protein